MTGSIALGRAIAPVSAGAADNRRRGRTFSRPTSRVGRPRDEGRADGSPPVAQRLETPTFIFQLSPFVGRRKRGARPVRKACHDASRFVKRATPRTASITARAHETLRTRQVYGMASPG